LFQFSTKERAIASKNFGLGFNYLIYERIQIEERVVEKSLKIVKNGDPAVENRPDRWKT
jgi:hypothetical protein